MVLLTSLQLHLPKVLGLRLILVETLIAGGVYNCRKAESTTVPRSPPATSNPPLSP